MSEQELEPLLPELGVLLESERSRPGLSPESKTRVLSRVRASIAAPGGGGGGDTTTPAPNAPVTTLGAKSLAGLGAAFLVGGLVGAAVHAAWVKPEVAVVEPNTPVSEPAVRAPVDPVLKPEELPLERAPTATEQDAKPVAHAAATPSASGPHADSALSEERSLLTTARTALSRNKPDAALAALRQHRARFPRGQLDEERESLWVQALALAGRTSEAEARAADFKREFPKSLLGPAVEATLDEAKQARDQ